MSSDKYDADVELPDFEDDPEDLPEPIRRMSSRVVVVTLLIALTVFIAVAFLLQSGADRIIASIPSLEKAWILSRVEGEDIADDTPKTVLDGRGVMLYLVAYGYDKAADDYFYYIDSPYEDLPQVSIEGEQIPLEKIRLFSFMDTTSIVYWYKLELSRGFLENTGLSDDQRMNWSISRKHRMGIRWWTIADVRADSYQYHYDYIGTMYYMAELEVVRGDDSENLIAELMVGDVSNEKGAQFPEGAHRITIAPTKKMGLPGAYGGFFNLPAFEEANWQPDAASATRDFRGGTSSTILAGALELLGYDTRAGVDDALPQFSELLYDNVTLDNFLFFRPPGNESGVIPFGENGVRHGDIIQRGDRYMVILANTPSASEPQPGVLTGDDEVLDAWNAPVQRTYAHLLQDGEGPIRIWRLNPALASSVE